VIEYQVQQTDRGASIAVRCDSEVDLERLRQRIVSGLLSVGVQRAQVTIQRTDRIPLQPTGKLKRFVPHAQTNGA
jgi:hypothetical protein